MFQVPVGPVHAGIIEPGHFLFSVAGEPVLYLQIRLFYTHKGTEKLFENMPVAHGVRLAESISGDSSFAHATAFCHAVERAANVEAPPRGARAAHDLPGTGAHLQPYRRHRRHRDRRGLRRGQHPRDAAQGARAAAERTAHRQPSPARHGLRSAASASIGAPRKSKPFASCSPGCARSSSRWLA